MSHERLLKTTRKRSAWLRSGLLLVCSIVLIGLADHAGVTRAIDRTLQHRYFELRGQRSSSQSVLLISLDENTVSEWGPPPWSFAQFETLISRVMDGEPAMVAVLEHGPRVLPESALDPQGRLAQEERDGRLILPSPDQVGHLGLRIGTGPVESIELTAENGAPSLLARTIERAGLDAPSATTLPVNYLGSASALPTVAAHRVASGEIPATTFADRIVVIGLQGERFTPVVPTPVGPLSPAEVQAHALSGLVDGAVWKPVPAWLQWLLVVLLCALGFYVTPKVSLRAVLIAGGVALVSLLAADYWLFATGIAQVDSAVLLCALGVAAVAAGLAERNQMRRELSSFSQWLLDQRRHDMQARSLQGNDEEFLRDFLRAARAYVEYESTIFAELPQGKHHLDFAIFVGATADDVVERRRDVRREPYLQAYRSHRPEWATRVFMNKELALKTLMVPLVELGRILGYWIINFREDAKITRQQLQMIELLSNQASIALERRRLSLQTRPHESSGVLRSPSVLLAALRDSRQTASSVMQNQYRVDEMFERLPVGVLVATLWGEIEQLNAKMRELLREAGIEDAAQLGLAQLIAELSGDEEDRVHAQLRQAMDAHVPLRIGPPDRRSRGTSAPSGILATHELMLTRVMGDGPGDAGSAANAAAHFILTAAERPKKSAARGPWLQDVSAPATVVDIMPKTGSGRN